MVYVNNKKYACATCIKGHRSSSCGHTDRALFEIKKKGRPVTQCEHCRQLRRTKQVHVKCMCEAGGDDASDPRVREGEVSMYPNGVMDILASVSVSVPYPMQTSRLETILNPCKCREGQPCHCCTPRTPISKRRDSTTDQPPSCCSGGTSDTPAERSSPEGTSGGCCSPDTMAACEPRCSCAAESTHKKTKKKGSCCGGGGVKSPVEQSSPSTSTPDPSSMDVSFSDLSDSGTLTPHDMSSTSSSHSLQRPMSPMSDLASRPLEPLSASQIMESTAEFSRCNCGYSCPCPGCTEHNPSVASLSPESCPTTCTTCLDCIGGYVGTASADYAPSPAATAYNPSPQETIEAFLERQAILYGLPPAPSARAGTTRLDPSSTFVLPPQALTNLSGPVARAVGMTQVRRMVCCAGRCACPEGRCGCDESCEGEGGCGGHHHHHDHAQHQAQTAFPFAPSTSSRPLFHSQYPFATAAYSTPAAQAHQHMPLSALQQSMYAAQGRMPTSASVASSFTGADPSAFAGMDPGFWGSTLPAASR